ncbi:hypothetical protein [Actinomadura rudentiformis]|uniref:Uncharacterized protein n=1 Tax=Actinomadura rudentiformis TaxID=359158 RepID=A0A6H9Z3F4_9ACTN|nr:hypothetical protein [Actinomadura rudentiformis]KAB2352612.1 hypothetical protein F8566_02855 [Actinomadura rudentiformis]
MAETVTTRFLVATNEGVTQLSSRRGIDHLCEALPKTRLGRTARALLRSRLLSIDPAQPAPTQWSPRLLHLGGAPEALQRVNEARHHVLLTSAAAPCDQPRHAQAARLVARVLAAAMSGDLVDLDSDQLLAASPSPGGTTEPERFVLGNEWIGVFVTLAQERDAEHCIRVGTAGMHRFALPEVMASEVPYGHMLTAANILRALAFRLLSDGGIPAKFTLDAGDLLRFWGARPAPAGRLSLRLTPAESDCSGCSKALAVLPPTRRGTGLESGRATGCGDPVWWEERAAEAMPKLVSASPE